MCIRDRAGATVSFDWDISGTIFEHLYFYVDNQYTASCDNEARGPWNGWTRYTHTFETGGVHQLEWRYVNSDAVSYTHLSPSCSRRMSSIRTG